MSALPCPTAEADSLATQRGRTESADQFELDCLEEMRGSVRHVRQYIEDEGPDDACLLSMLIDRGLPLKDRSQRDDRYCELLDEQIEKFRDDFDRWARVRQIGQLLSPLQKYIRLVKEDR